MVQIESRSVALDSLLFKPISNRERLGLLSHSIRRYGFFSSRPIDVIDLGTGRYAVKDGRRRATAARRLGLRSVPAHVISYP